MSVSEMRSSVRTFSYIKKNAFFQFIIKIKFKIKMIFSNFMFFCFILYISPVFVEYILHIHTREANQEYTNEAEQI